MALEDAYWITRCTRLNTKSEQQTRCDAPRIISYMQKNFVLY